jgi:hypothetical protein
VEKPGLVVRAEGSSPGSRLYISTGKKKNTGSQMGQTIFVTVPLAISSTDKIINHML